MPLCVILWIVCLAPFIIAGWLILAHMIDMDADFGCHVLVALAVVFMLAAGSLPLYKSVRDVMMPDHQIELKAEAN